MTTGETVNHPAVVLGEFATVAQGQLDAADLKPLNSTAATITTK